MSVDVEEKLRLAAAPSADLIERIGEGKSPITRSILARIRDHFYEPGHSVKETAASLGVNHRHLKSFGREVGITAWQLIQECRMETALRLLRDSKLPVEEVAMLIGYDSARAFERLCRRWCGLSPATLRAHAAKVRRELRALPDDATSWHFERKVRRGESSPEELSLVIEHLERLYGLDSPE